MAAGRTPQEPAEPVLPDLRAVVQQPSTPEQIAEHILSSIVVGALAEGSALPPERQLAQALEVSRSSVRLALARLEQDGVLERRRGRNGGTFVRPLHEARSRLAEVSGLEAFWQAREELLDARALLNRLLSETAARRRGQEHLKAILAAQAEHARVADAMQARAADGRFHSAIAEASGNRELARLAVEVDSRINLGFRHDPFSASLHAQAVEHHRQIAQAIADADPAAAGELMEQHFRATSAQRAPEN